MLQHAPVRMYEARDIGTYKHCHTQFIALRGFEWLYDELNTAEANLHDQKLCCLILDCSDGWQTLWIVLYYTIVFVKAWTAGYFFKTQ